MNNYNKSILVIVFVALFLLTAICANSVITPTDTYAHPEYGFTPPPPPPPPPLPPGPGGGGKNNGGGGDDDDDDTAPGDQVTVQLGHCDLSCAANYFLNVDLNQTASIPVAVPEMTVRVKLVHRDSKWITEGVLSNVRNSRFDVPYPGEWEVFLVDVPEFTTAGLINPVNLNLDQLKAALANGPVSLGTIEANAGPQLVECPIECIIEPAPDLPVTGGEQPTYTLLWIKGAYFIVIGFLMLLMDYKSRVLPS
jgi:hypothetical protein